MSHIRTVYKGSDLFKWVNVLLFYKLDCFFREITAGLLSGGEEGDITSLFSVDLRLKGDELYQLSQMYASGKRVVLNDFW